MWTKIKKTELHLLFEIEIWKRFECIYALIYAYILFYLLIPRCIVGI